MKIQSVVSDVCQRLETASRHYQGAFKAYVDAQRKALTVVTRNGQSLANTEIGAAKNIFASARASFDHARNDGLLQLASKPQSYLPRSRPQLIAAYKTTIDLLVKTGNELNDVVSSGYRSVRVELAGQQAPEKSATETAPADSPARKTAARRKTASSSSATKPATASTAKSTGTKAASASESTASKTATTKKTTAPRKRAAPKKAATDAATTGANTTNDANDASSSTVVSPAKDS